ncbi:proline dehydrogenase family protein [Nocardioides marmoraquaticus]
MLRQPILLLARSPHAERLVSNLPLSRAVVRRFVPGTQTDEAVRATRELVGDGLLVTLDHLGEDTLDRAQADATVAAYLDLLEALGAAGLARSAEVSVKLSAIGQALDDDGPALATANARRICEAARTVGTTVTLDMEDHTTVDLTLATLRELRRDFPETGAVVQAYLHRTEADCRELAHEGSRVRLCKGAYDEPESVAFQSREEVDKSYVRCLKVLMAGSGYPMVASHDPRMIKIASALAVRAGRVAGTYEFQMLYGVRPDEQRRLAEAGEQVRVYLPYGEQWYGYLMRRLAERPQNLAFFARALVSRS